MMCQHPNVIQVYALNTSIKGDFLLVLERAEHGDLYNYYEKKIDEFNTERR